MKKRLLSIVISFMFIISCFCLSACSNKYDKLEFNIEYSLDASTWQDANNGVLLNYNGKDDLLQITKDQDGVVYFRVTIKNVKDKYLDDIIVSKVGDSSNVNFAQTIIKPKEVFSINLSGNAITSLKFYETNSGKSTIKQFNVYRTLEGLEVDKKAKTPAVVVDNTQSKVIGEIDLNKLTNIDYLPLGTNGETLTNQTGVKFSLVNNINNVTLDNDVLKIKQGFTDSSIKVKATSIHNNSLSVDFDVKVIEQINNLTVKYENSTKDVDSITLYSLSANYHTEKVVVNNNTPSDTYKYITQVFVDGELYDATNPTPKNSLYISGGEGVYSITSMDSANTKEGDTPDNIVKFSFTIDGLDFSASTYKLDKSKEIKVERKELATGFSVNNVEYSNGAEVGADIYETTASYDGLKLSVNVKPKNSINSKIVIEAGSDIEIYDFNHNKLTSNEIDSGKTIYVKFVAGNTNNTNLIFKVCNTPGIFSGETVATGYASLTYKLNKKVTANEITVYSDSNCSIPVNSENPLLINGATGGYAYVKVKYSGGDFADDTVKLVSSALKFNNDKNEINLNACSYSSVEGGRVYAVPIKKCEYGIDENIDVIVANGEINTGTSFAVKTVATTTENDITLSISDSEYLQDLTAEVKDANTDDASSDYYFALEYLKTVDIAFKGKISGGNETSEYSIADVSASDNTPNDDINKFSSTAIKVEKLNNYLINFMAEQVKTAVKEIKVTYYKSNGDVVEIDEKIIMVEFAVYNPVVRIDLKLTNNKIAYINEQFTEIRTSQISYNLVGKVGQPTDTIYFSNSIELTNNISYEKDATYGGENLTTDTDITFNDDTIKLNKDLSSGTITVTYKVKQFGKVRDIDQKDITIFDPSIIDEINLYNNEQDNYLDEDPIEGYFVDMSFLGNTTGVTQANFYAQTVYYDENPILDGLENYTMLAYSLDELKVENGKLVKFDNEIVIQEENSNKLSIELNKNSENIYQVVITAYKANNGGVFRLHLKAQDSNLEKTIIIRVSDGSKDYAYRLNQTNFRDIRSDLQANYVLTEDITLGDGWSIIGTTAQAFDGTLCGSSEKIYDNASINTTYTITYTINNGKCIEVSGTNSSKNYGLFANLGSNAKVFDINFDVTIEKDDVFTNNTEDSTLNLGLIAAENEGEIENVKLTIKSSRFTTSGNSLNFGAVAVNNGDISNLKIKSEKLEITSNIPTANIGLVAGTNNGNITGKYDGKLTDLSFDVYANLIVTTTVTTDNYIYVGGIAGSNSGTIKDSLISGEITSPTGYLGGIAGNASDSSDINTDIDNCVAIGLDLTGKYVAGIVAKADNTNISNVRFVSAQIESIYTTNGKITASDTGAGIVATIVDKSSATIVYGSVESFIEYVIGSTTEVFYAIEASTVYGIGGTNVDKCFVRANLKSTSETEVTTVTNNAINDTYFIGKIYNKTGNVGDYVVEYNGTKLTIDEGEDIQSKISTLYGSLTKGIWNLQEGYNTIKVADSTYYLPYLLKDNKPAMIIAPSEISASINEDFNINFIYIIGYKKVSENATFDAETKYYKYENNQYVWYESITERDFNDQKANLYTQSFVIDGNYNVSDTAIVNFYQGAKNNENTHKLFTNSNGKGLVNLLVLPTDADGGLKVRIIEGNNNAYIDTDINNNYTITFNSYTGNNPVVIECSSVFNTSIKEYVVLFANYGVSDIILKADDIINAGNVNYDYELFTFEGADDIILTLDVINKNIIEYNNLFDIIGIKEYLAISATETGETDYFTVSPINNFNEFEIKLKTLGADASEIEVYIKFELMLNLTKYFGANYFPQVDSKDQFKLIGSKTLKIDARKSAIDLMIDANDITTFESEANIKIGMQLFTAKENTPSTSPQPINWHIENNDLVLEETNKDSLYFTFSVAEESREELNRLLNVTNQSSIYDLFDIFVNMKTNTSGYYYTLNLKLKDENNYRYLTSNLKINIKASSIFNSKVYDDINVVITPTSIKSLRIENYNVTENYTNITSVIQKNNLESAIITPGGIGGVMVVYLQPAYAFIALDNNNQFELLMESSYINVRGTQVKIDFRQLVYNDEIDKYQSVYPVNEYTTDGIILKRISNIDGSFNGKLYVHTQLVSFSGISEDISATVTVKTLNNQIKTAIKTVKTEYLPGVTLSYDENKLVSGKTNEYFVEKATYQNKVKVEVFGYQFNSNPDYHFSWNLDNNTEYTYEFKDNGAPVTVSADNINQLQTEELCYLVGGQYKRIHNNKNIKIGEMVYKINDASKIYLKTDTGYTNPLYIGDYVGMPSKDNIDDIEKTNTGSYILYANVAVYKNIPASFELSASLTLATEDDLVTSVIDKVLIFHPTDYILYSNSAYSPSLSGNVLYVGRNAVRELELKFNTDGQNELSSIIYEDLINDIGTDNILDLFSYVVDGKTKYISEDNEYFKASINKTDKAIYITGKSTFNTTITFSCDYEYVCADGEYKIQFKKSPNGKHTLSFSFELDISPATSEENAIPIYEASQLTDDNLIEGADYILMEDITLTNFTPLTKNIASLDGNNKIISIENFVTTEGNNLYGLFSSISTYEDRQTKETKPIILKNIVVDYSKVQQINLENVKSSEIIFGGLVANNNGGLIYNCDVMNCNSVTTKNVEIIVPNYIIETDEEDEIVSTTLVNFKFGGLVGVNSGNITNSRVGRVEFDKISASETITTVTHKTYSPIVFTIDKDNEDNAFNASVAGFVSENSGIISSSYVSNTSVINSSSNTASKTAGFVAENLGTINTSFVKALESSVKHNQPYSTGAVIESTKNGTVAGFVHTNDGNIANSYANTHVKSKSIYISGFAYVNNGSIASSYSSCTLNDGKIGQNDISEQPFIGISADNKLQSFGTLTNTYYLTNDKYIVIDTNNPDDKDNYGKPQAKGLNLTNFTDINNLYGFMFVDSLDENEREQGIWSKYTIDDEYRMLPELNSANTIATAIRYEGEHEVIEGNQKIYNYVSAYGYELGTKNNPDIIRDENEFNNKLVMSNDTTKKIYQTGYFRLIDNLDFSTKGIAIKTRANFVFGDVNSNISSFDGNFMTISGINLDNANEEEYNDVSAVGLFAEVENAYVKNLNLNFVQKQFSTGTVQYAGGLAGKITDASVINVNLDGAGTTILGYNFAGGMAGLVQGKSIVYNVTSNLNAWTQNNTDSYNVYYNYNDYLKINNVVDSTTQKDKYQAHLTTLSYAGGLTGVIDLAQNKNTNFNLAHIDIYAENFSLSDNNQDANIKADYAGGVSGYAGKNTNAFKLRFYNGGDAKIYGEYASGGIYAINLGGLTASQVTAIEGDIDSEGNKTGQYAIDSEFAKYVVALYNAQKDKDFTSHDLLTSINFDGKKIGNANLIKSDNYAGGLIGIGVGGSIHSCYSKASFETAKTIGGLIGLSVSDKVIYSYAVPYVNLSEKVENVGGLIGKAISFVDSNTTSTESSFINIVNNLQNKQEVCSDIQYTFSTVLVNNNSLLTKKADGTYDYVNAKIDYLSADYIQNKNGEQVVNIKSNNAEKLTKVYVGLIKYSKKQTEKVNIVTNSNATNLEGIELYLLHDLSEYNLEQSATFDEIFATWYSQYWTMNNLKYYPLLLENDVENYIEINEAKDFEVLVNNPDKSYKITKDITAADMQSWLKTRPSNWVFDTEFTGVLIGEKKILDNSSSIPTVAGLFVNTNTNDTAGLFRVTNTAVIRNINFVWDNRSNGAIDLANNVTTVAGLSCDDRDSFFANVNVAVNSNETDNKYGYLVNNGTNSATGFGGLIGKSDLTKITDCNFAGNVKLNLLSNDESYFGGLIAKSVSTIGDGDITDNTSISNCSVNENCEFEITVNGEKEYNQSDDSNSSYIGGAVGYMENTALHQTNVGNRASSVKTNIKVSYNNLITNENNITVINYFGGLVGYSLDSQISSNNAVTKVSLSGSENNSIYAGGLVGCYKVSSEKSTSIKDSNTYTELNLGKFSIASVSAGVGYASGSFTISQCLFNGNITSEDESSSITTIYAGGAVGTVGTVDESSEKLSLNATMSTADLILGTTDTKNMYLGGLVGCNNDSLTINSSVSSGKIIPINCSVFSEAEDNGQINIGGMVGKSTSSVTFENSYTVSTILTDGLTNSAFAYSNINAIVGFGPQSKQTVEANQTTQTTEETQSAQTVQEGETETKSTNSTVYFSSDITLAPDDYELGTNISANTFLFGSDFWATGLLNNDIFASDKGAIPKLACLTEELIAYDIIGIDGKYKQGSVFSPIKIVDKDYELKEKDANDNEIYNYYIISATDNLLSTITITGTLNGVLIGGETEYLISSNPSNSFEENNYNYYGIVGKVNKRSAISNMHIKINTNLTISENTTGIIAGQNNGTIFNCSVQGTGLTITCAEGVTDDVNVGLIAGQNNGVVTHSYSSAEIVETDVTELSGLVNSNNGAIVSSYFTGYINNKESNTNSAGIIVENENGFAYNSYMAGVITNVSNNSFAACEINGVNNYIDKFANIENIDLKFKEEGKTTVTYLKTVSTAELMSGAVNGNWHRSVHNDVMDYLFGYNYNYPIYNFNKYYADSNGLKKLSISDSYNLNTGSGSSGDYFKIPHLGVLSSIQGLMANKKYDLHYAVIYDIDGKIDNKNNITFDSVGSTSASNGFAVADQFSCADFVSVENFDGVKYTSVVDTQTNEITCVITDLDLSDKARTISNITGSLFDNISAAKINYIKFAGTWQVENGGVIGKTVIGDTTIDNIEFSKTTVKGSDNTGALFGTISSGSIKLTNITTTNLQIVDGARVGIIAGQMDGGTITGDNKELSAIFEKVSSDSTIIGGAVGTYTAGTINNLNLAIECNHSNAVIGGIIGKTTTTTTKTTKESTSTTETKDPNVSNITITLKGSSWNAQTFGGLIGVNEIGIELDSCTLDTEQKLEINFSKVDSEVDNAFGLIAGTNTNSAVLTATSFALKNGSVEIYVNYSNPTEDETKSGHGGLVGILDGKLNVTLKSNFTPTISVNNGANLGGFVGLYNSGDFYINPQGKTLDITLHGTKNVGGAIGYAPNGINIDQFLSATKSKVFTSDKEFATISNEGITATKIENVGGLIGKLSGNIVEGEGNSITDDEGNTTTKYDDNTSCLINNNPIQFAECQSDTSAFNIGGVIGLVENATTIQNLQNKALIQYLQNKASISIKDNGVFKDNTIIFKAGYTSESVYTVKTVNVGGVIGYINGNNGNIALSNISNIALSNISNTAGIQGYQNVGGLIGYAESINFGSTQSEQISAQTENTTVTTGNTVVVKGVVNVGGIIGFANNAIIGAKPESSQATVEPKESTQTLTLSASVTGNVNVGGAVGKMSGGEICNVTVTSSITATYFAFATTNKNITTQTMFIPTSVGGLIGHASGSAKIKNNKVENITISSTKEGDFETIDGSDDNYETTSSVISTVSNYMADITELDNPDEAYNFGKNLNDASSDYKKVSLHGMTSGFGGFIGTTDDSVVLVNETNEQGEEIINIVNGITISASLGVNVGTFYGYYSGNSITTPKLSGNNNIAGGYKVGGVIGNINSGNDIKFETGSIQVENSATINVQAMFKETTSTADNTPSTGEEVATILTGENTSIGETTNKTLAVSDITGMYVGGVFGEATDISKLYATNISKLEATNAKGPKITLYTDNSYYIGGLVGRLTGNLEEGILGKGNIAVEGDNVSNFGALVGMLKVTGDHSSNAVTVKGDHTYAFTVNTIENENYYDGPTTYEVEKYEGSSIVDLIAQAVYVNKDSFMISVSKNEELYDGQGDYNPVLGEDASWGWAKDYTMFRTLQRCIPQSKNNGADWDAISVIYDAGNITNVGTIKNLGLTKDELFYNGCKDDFVDIINENNDYYFEEGGKRFYITSDDSDDDYCYYVYEGRKIYFGKDGKLTDYKISTNPNSKFRLKSTTDNYYIFDPDYVSYTVYEEVPTQAKIYSAIGIGSIFYDDEGNYYIRKETKSENVLEEDNLENVPEVVQLTNDLQNNLKWVSAILGFTSAPTNVFNIDFAKNFPGLTYLDYNKENYETIGENNVENLQQYTDTTNGGDVKFYVYPVTNYKLQLETTVNVTAYFKFELLFENRSLGGDNNKMSYSGSMMNINGVHSTSVNKAIIIEGKQYPWLTAVQIAVEVIIILASYGASTGFSVFKSAARLAGKAISKIIKIASKIGKLLNKLGKVGKALKFAAKALIFSLILSQVTATTVMQSTYFKTYDQSVGFMAPTYTRELEYNVEYKGKQTITTLINGYDTLEINGEYYIYHSSIRPSDYYQHYYIVFYKDGDDDKRVAMAKTDVVITVNDSGDFITVNSGDFEGWYKCTIKINDKEIKEAYAKPYYIYANGSYYATLNAVDFETVVAQPYFNPQDYKETVDYLYSGNYAYVRKNFEGNNYNEDIKNALIEKGITPSIDKELTFIPVSQDLFDEENGVYKVEDNKIYEEKQGKNIYYYKDYGFITKEYQFSPLGDINVYARGKNVIPSKVAKYTTCSDKPSKGTENVDWIKTKDAYYKFDEFVTDVSGKDYNDYQDEDDLGNTIYVNCYLAESGVGDKEPYYLLNPELFDDDDDIKGVSSITQTATYYYYEGGYITDKDNTFVYDYMPETVTINLGAGNTCKINLYTQYTKNDGTYKIDDNNNIKFPEGAFDNEGYYRTIEVYKKDTTSTEVYKKDTTSTTWSYNELINYLNNKNPTETYYYSDEFEDGNENDYLLKNYYEVSENNKLIVPSIHIIEDGLLSSARLVLTGQTSNKHLNYNKYLINSEAQIYTRYYYTDGPKRFGNEKWDGYNFYQEGKKFPNPGYTTNFREGCYVIMFGGETVYFDNNTTSSGTITML